MEPFKVKTMNAALGAFTVGTLRKKNPKQLRLRAKTSLTLSLPRVSKLKIEKISNFILQDMEKTTVTHESIAHKLSFEWSHTRVLSTDLKVRTTIIDLMLASGSDRVNSKKPRGHYCPEPFNIVV